MPIFICRWRGTDSMHFDQVWTVHWTSVGNGAYPDFDGSIAVRADEDYVEGALSASRSPLKRSFDSHRTNVTDRIR